MKTISQNWGPRQVIKVIAPIGAAIGATAEQTTAVVAFVVAGIGFAADLALSWAAKKWAERTTKKA
jgi:hypothetical protein